MNTIRTHVSQWLILLPAFLLMLNSCSPARKVARAPLNEETPEVLVGKLRAHELKFDWLSAKFSAEYKNNKKENSFNGHIRIRKDSLIWLSLTPMLGIEAIRLMISQDSVKMINRLNDTWFAGDYTYVNRFLGTNIDYDLLQAFLLGNDLEHYDSAVFKASIDKREYKLSTNERRKDKKYARNSAEAMKIFLQNIWLDPDNFRITHADVAEAGKENIRLESAYDKFEPNAGQLFPGMAQYTIKAANTIRVKVEFSRVQIDTPQQFPFRIPDDFTRVNE